MLYPDQRAKAKEQTRYWVRIPERERTRDGLLAVLADGSTDEQVKFTCSERWGSETQATHCREEEARYNVL